MRRLRWLWLVLLGITLPASAGAVRSQERPEKSYVRIPYDDDDLNKVLAEKLLQTKGLHELAKLFGDKGGLFQLDPKLFEKFNFNDPRFRALLQDSRVRSQIEAWLDNPKGEWKLGPEQMKA